MIVYSSSMEMWKMMIFSKQEHNETWRQSAKRVSPKNMHVSNELVLVLTRITIHIEFVMSQLFCHTSYQGSLLGYYTLPITTVLKTRKANQICDQEVEYYAHTNIFI